MCGISGKINLNGQVIKKTDLLIMNDCLKHRGPDDGGIKLLDNVGLGNRRLAIIDLSKKGHQPMSNYDKTVWIAYNGEIYNFQEIKKDLLKKNYKFRSNSDTEVIIACYEKYGVECLKFFRGMFAFALYDTKKKLFFAARDRLGEKPFKYFFDGKTFVFASEIKSILTQKEVIKEVDLEAIRLYLYWGYIPSPKTGFKNIFKLPAAHYLLIKNNKVVIKKYWDFQPVFNEKRSEQETIFDLQKIVKESVRLRMIADVPVGAFLSGGIDSCVVVGLMSKLTQKPIHTFTIGFKNWQDSELEPARISAKFHHTKHQEFVISPNISDILPNIVAAYDEPFGDVSAVPSYIVSQIARKYVTVALNGDGGDENFLGYGNYAAFLKAQQFGPLAPGFNLLYQILKPFSKIGSSNRHFQRALRVADILKKSGLKGYPQYARGYLNILEFNSLFPENSFDHFQEFEKWLKPTASDEVAAIAHQDLTNILPDGLMTKMDIASMQWGLEARSPLLDHKLVEYTATIPTRFKIKNHISKYIFRKAFNDLIPEKINRLPKRGFVMPVQSWLKHDLINLVEQTLNNPAASLYSIISFTAVEKILKFQKTTEIDFSFMIWRLLMLELWFEQYFS